MFTLRFKKKIYFAKNFVLSLKNSPLPHPFGGDFVFFLNLVVVYISEFSVHEDLNSLKWKKQKITTFRNNNISQWITKFDQLCDFVIRETSIGTLLWAVECRWLPVPFYFIFRTRLRCIHWKLISIKLSLKFINTVYNK